MNPSAQHRQPAGTANPPPIGGEPYRVSITPSGLEVAGWLSDVESIESLIRVLEAGKLLLRPDLEGAPVADTTHRLLSTPIHLLISSDRV